MPDGADETRSEPRTWLSAALPDRAHIAEILRRETVGGVLLVSAAIVALILANSGAHDGYESMLHAHLGPLNVEHWASDGGLALFFFLAGLELKHELTVGSLSRPADALVPVAAAVAGMVVPACIYLAVVAASSTSGITDGWAIPMATDIAFALAVLAIVGRSLPASLRAFLLTLAVVDDLGAIAVIAIVFTSDIDFLSLLGAIALMVVYAVCQRLRVTTPLIYIPVAFGCWWLMYESGVHATVAGVALGLLTRVHADEGEEESPADRLEHRLRPISAGIAVPVFALMSAGVEIHAGSHLVTDALVIGIVAGLVLGKTIGVLGGSWLITKVTAAELAPDISWRDVTGVAIVSGIGFTVSLLIASLAFTGATVDDAKVAVLAGSVIAAGLAAVVLHRRNRHHASLP